tara:strand:- start:20292 stop:20522 length:231 start_codon:yes stop_codon:yes gene_type:complete
MADYDDTNTIILFAEDVEEGSKRPNVKGKANWKGETIQVALWKGESKNGKKYLRGTLQEPQEAKAKTSSVKEEAPF